MCQLLIDQLEWFGYHGVFEEEREEGQLFQISATIDAMVRPSEDRLDETISYADCVSWMKKVFYGKKYHLLESLSEEICRELFSRDERISSISIEIKKMHPPIPEKMRSIGVRLCRSRSI